mgnify:CR=1 FL=1
MKSYSISRTKLAIVVFTLITAFIHLVVLNILMGRVDVLFTLNGLGFLGLLAVYFLPFTRRYLILTRWALLVYTAATILAWVAIGDKSLPSGALGYFTKLDELALLIALWWDRQA